MAGLAKKFHFAYTRYADDLTFSGTKEEIRKIPQLLWSVKQVVTDEGFTIHPDKLRIMRNGARKEVTGVVVNEKLNISRKTLDNFRATLYQIEKDGPEGKVWGNQKGVKLLPAIKSYAAYVGMIHPEKGERFKAQVQKIFEKYYKN